MSAPPVFYDRIKESSTTTGTGTVTLAGAAAGGFRTFTSVFANATQVFYLIIDSANAWEVGQGTFTTSGTTLSRDTVLSSSASGAKISIVGPSTVWVDVPASIVNASAPYYGTFANRPTAGFAGKTGWVTDGIVQHWLDNGSAWCPVLNNIIGAQPTAAASWTQINSAGTLVDNNGSLVFTGTNDAGTNTFRGWGIAASSASSFIELGFEFDFGNTTTSAFLIGGVAFRESATSKAYTCSFEQGQQNATVSVLQANTWTANTTESADRKDGCVPGFGLLPAFLRMDTDGTTIFAKFSHDLVNWTQFDSIAKSSAFTTAWDTVAVFSNGRSVQPVMRIVHERHGT